MSRPKLSFYNSVFCLSRGHCLNCRKRSAPHRARWADRFDTGGKVDFPCIPLGLRFDDEPGGAEQAYPAPLSPEDLDRLMNYAPARPILPQGAAPRPRPTLGMMASWAMAASLGRWASPETVAARDEACNTCDGAAEDAGGRYCNRCGCGVYGEERALKNLAAYEENMPGLPGYNEKLATWGCKHPLRGQLKDPAGNPAGPRWGWPLPVIKP